MTTATSKNDGINGALKLLLRSFRLKGFEENYAQVADHATKARLSYEAYLYDVAKIEAEERYGGDGPVGRMSVIGPAWRWAVSVSGPACT